MTTRSLDSTFVLKLEWSTDRLIKHDVDAQDDADGGGGIMTMIMMATRSS